MGLPKVWYLFGEDHLPYRILLLARMLERETQNQLMEQFSLSLAEWRLLAIACAMGPCTASDIGGAGGIDRAEISRAMRKLEPKGLVVREADPNHGKRLIISVTPAGTELRARVVAARRRRFRELVQNIPPEERAVLDSAITTMAQAIKDDPVD
ncbi:MarR family transcriptional regulator [Aurantiacibacter xanthus]|uniref:MarR family transcriptional regulator n=1 Tax=Aurantiacibacter xanthus TaxID=1784712 RepID=A0A3A1NYP3_9SPHN|nr:MarR family winged helix-turn-helix transcriptional regulator [Aurantiacibacter xanthus]RIV80616.1 MarR family transcriptional regulator [Aurantiacibacter xanthus]